VWAPDAKRIALSAIRNGKPELLVKDVGGISADRTLAEDVFPESWTVDGKFILAMPRISPSRFVNSAMILPLDGGQPQEIDLPRAMAPRSSPDGNLIAYSSSASAPPQIFVVARPPASGKWQISNDGGFQPVWRQDGKELFFLAPDGSLMSADITISPSFRSGVPQKLFATGIESLYLISRNSYAVSADGQRFLIRVARQSGASEPIHVLLNWTALLKKESAP
jgi:Tol biopolymer transport system component